MFSASISEEINTYESMIKEKGEKLFGNECNRKKDELGRKLMRKCAKYVKIKSPVKKKGRRIYTTR